jgi:hypothetical protein
MRDKKLILALAEKLYLSNQLFQEENTRRERELL